MHGSKTCVCPDANNAWFEIVGFNAVSGSVDLRPLDLVGAPTATTSLAGVELNGLLGSLGTTPTQLADQAVFRLCPAR